MPRDLNTVTTRPIMSRCLYFFRRRPRTRTPLLLLCKSSSSAHGRKNNKKNEKRVCSSASTVSRAAMSPRALNNAAYKKPAVSRLSCSPDATHGLHNSNSIIRTFFFFLNNTVRVFTRYYDYNTRTRVFIFLFRFLRFYLYAGEGQGSR